MPKMKQVFPGFKKSTKDVSNWNKNDEALRAACIPEADSKKVEQLLARKIYPTKVDHQGHTTFHCTARAGKTQIIQLFLKHNVDPACIDVQGRTPLHEACKYNQMEVAKLLMQNYDYTGSDNTGDAFGLTPLHHACIGGSQRCVYLLLQNNYSPNEADKEGRTSLHYASSVPICKLLVDRGADLNACDEHNKTALIIAASYANVDVARYLVNNGCNTVVVDSQGHNAKWYSVHKKPNTEIQNLLDNAPVHANWTHEHEASPDRADQQGHQHVLENNTENVYSELTDQEDVQIEIDIHTSDSQNGVGVSQVEVGIVPLDQYQEQEVAVYDHIPHDSDDNSSLQTSHDSVGSLVGVDHAVVTQQTESHGMPNAIYDNPDDDNEQGCYVANHRLDVDDPYSNTKITKKTIVVHETVQQQQQQQPHPEEENQLHYQHQQQARAPSPTLSSSQDDHSSFNPQEEDYRELLEEHDIIKRELETVNKENRQLKDQIDGMNSQLIYQDALSLPSPKHLKETETRLEEEMERNSELANEIKCLRKEMNDKDEQADMSPQKTDSNWEDDGDELFGDSRKRDDHEVAVLAARLMQLNQENQLLRQQIQQYENELQTPLQARSPSEQELQSLLQYQELQQAHVDEVTQLQDKIVLLKSQNESFLKADSASATDMEALREEVKSLRAQLQKSEAAREISDMERKLEQDESAAEMGRLREALEEQVRQLQERVDKQEEHEVTQNNAAKLLVAGSHRKPRTGEDKRDDEMDMTELKQELVILREENERLQKKNAADEENLLQEMLDEMQANHEDQKHKLALQLKEVQQENERLSIQVNSGAPDIEMIPRTEYDELRQTHVEQMQEYANQLERLEQEKDHLRQCEHSMQLERVEEVQQTQIQQQVENLNSPKRRRQLADETYGELQDAHRAQVLLLADRVAELETQKEELRCELDEHPALEKETVVLEVTRDVTESLQVTHNQELVDLEDKLKLQKDDHTHQISKLRDKWNHLQQDHSIELAKLHSHNAQLEDEKANLQKQVANQEREQKQALEELHHEMMTTQQAEMDKLEAEMAAIERERDRLQRSIATATAAVAVGSGEKNQLEDKIERLQEENIRLLEDVSKSQKRRNDSGSDDEDEYNVLKIRITDLESERKDLNDKVTMAAATAVVASDDQKRLEDQIERLQDENTKLHIEASKVHKERKDSGGDDENESNQLKSRITDLLSERKDLNKKLLALSRSEALTRAQIEKMQAEHDSQRDKLQQDLDDLKWQNSELSSQLRPEVEEQVQVQTAGLMTATLPMAPPRRRNGRGVTGSSLDEEQQCGLELKIEQLEKDKGELAGQKADLEGKYSNMVNSQSYVEQELAELNFQLETLSGKNCPDELQQEMQQLQQGVRQLQIKMQCPTDWPALVARECERLRNENHQLRRHMSLIEEEQEHEQEEREQLEAQLVEMGVRMEEANVATENATSTATAEKRILQSELEKVQADLRDQEQRTNELDASGVAAAKVLQCRNLELQAEVDELQGEHDKTKQHMVHLQNIADTSRSLDSDNAQLLIEIEKYKEDLEKSRILEANIRSDLEHSRIEVESSRTKVDEYMADVEKANTEARQACTEAELAHAEAAQSRIEAEKAHADAEEMRALTEKIQMESEQVCNEADSNNKEMALVMAKLQQDNNDLLSENRTLKADLTEIEEKLRQRLEALQDSGDEDNSVSKNEYDRIREENKRLSNELEELGDDMEQVKTDYAKASRRAGDAAGDVEKLREDNVSLMEEVQETNKQLAYLISDNKDLGAEILLLKKRSSNADILREDNENLRDEIRDLRQNIDKQTDLITSLKGDELLHIDTDQQYRRLHNELDDTKKKKVPTATLR